MITGMGDRSLSTQHSALSTQSAKTWIAYVYFFEHASLIW
jgi:hypothetical protein